MSEQKKNKNRRINTAHVKRLEKIRTGTVQPTRTISLSDRGSVVLYNNFFSQDKANNILSLCRGLEINVPFFMSNGRKVDQPRASIWFGPLPYSYSKFVLPPNPFSTWLEQIRKDLVAVFGVDLNSCLINWYRNGLDRVSWHADDEPMFGLDPTIVSLSFGVSRQFELCRKLKNIRPRVCDYSLSLEHGSVLIMKGDVQRNWLHRVPVDDTISEERFNLTFRNVIM